MEEAYTGPTKRRDASFLLWGAASGGSYTIPRSKRVDTAQSLFQRYDLPKDEGIVSWDEPVLLVAHAVASLRR